MNFNSARQAWHDAFTIFDRSPDPFQTKVDIYWTDNGNRIVHGIEAGKVQAVVAQLPPVMRSWGMFAYSFRFSDKDYERLCQYLMAEYSRRHGAGQLGKKFKATARFLMLVHVALKDMKRREQCGRAMQLAEAAALIGVDEGNFQRDWRDVYERMLNIIEDVIPKALGPVAKLVNEERQKREAA